jgi:hypothetical protein
LGRTGQEDMFSSVLVQRWVHSLKHTNCGEVRDTGVCLKRHMSGFHSPEILIQTAAWEVAFRNPVSKMSVSGCEKHQPQTTGACTAQQVPRQSTEPGSVSLTISGTDAAL